MGDKRTSKQIEFHHGKGVNRRGAWVGGGLEWSFQPFLFLISGVKLQVWLFSFSIYTAHIRPRSIAPGSMFQVPSKSS